ncbi:MAG: FAD-dependent oxidoreductase, partial [Planctomycetales bacterium]|nr:FAD-dependent oxidoreductase [Planctomycetales bacterium]
MNVQSYDCLIVGGGPAGSTCAWQLRQAGAGVLVLDKASFPRDKTCAGWITPSVVESLELDVDEYCHNRTWQPIHGFRCGFVNGGSVNIDCSEPVSFGIRRREFDDYLLRRAGVVAIQHHVSRIERRGGAWLIDGIYSAPMLVGAGGNFCPVARFLGVSRGTPESLVFAQEVEFALTESELARLAVAADRPELYFCKDLRGYGWCFRKHEFLNVGFGRTERNGLSHRVADFCDFLHQAGRVRFDLPARFHGHAYRLNDGNADIPAADGVLLIGDSAGLA